MVCVFSHMDTLKCLVSALWTKNELALEICYNFGFILIVQKKNFDTT